MGHVPQYPNFKKVQERSPCGAGVERECAQSEIPNYGFIIALSEQDLGICSWGPLITKLCDQPGPKSPVFVIQLFCLTSGMLLSLRFPLLIVATFIIFIQAHGRGKHISEGIT